MSKAAAWAQAQTLQPKPLQHGSTLRFSVDTTGRLEIEVDCASAYMLPGDVRKLQDWLREVFE